MQADVERFLALLFADAGLRQRFLDGPVKTAREFGLSPEESCSLASIPAQDLQTASRSFERKRWLKARHSTSGLGGWLSRLLRFRQ